MPILCFHDVSHLIIGNVTLVRLNAAQLSALEMLSLSNLAQRLVDEVKWLQILIEILHQKCLLIFMVVNRLLTMTF